MFARSRSRIDRTTRHRHDRVVVGSVALLCVIGLAGLVGACGNGGGSDEPSESTAVLTADDLPVLVAAEEIPTGTEAGAAYDTGLLAGDTVTAAEYPADAIVSLEQIEGMSAVAPIPPGTVIRLGMFTDEG